MRTALVRTLGEKLHADSRLTPYLLVDPMLREPFSKDWLTKVDAETVVVPVRHPSLKDNQRPLLIRLRSRDAPLLEVSVDAALAEQLDPNAEQDGGFSIGGWLLSATPQDSLAARLAVCMQAAAPSSAGRRLVRWVDRRVLEWMWPVLGQGQRATLFRDIDVWFTIDRRNQLVTYRELGGNAGGKLRLDARQWAHAQDCQAVQDLLRGWRRFCPELPIDYLRRAADAVQSIKRLKTIGRQDLVLLGAYVLQVHPRLMEHPLLVEAIRRANDGGIPLADVLAEIPDPDGWEMMRADLGWPVSVSTT